MTLPHVATALFLIVGLPQVFDLLVSRKAYGLSPLNSLLSTLSFAVLLLYAVQLEDSALALTMWTGVMISGFITVLIYLYGSPKKGRQGRRVPGRTMRQNFHRHLGD
jgi:uncharacterized protein with PQ loop repeat